ncbi:flagellar basal-body MS-ring/collar protein FliF [uncultured Legionella sp.]|uniref:flagellar basal-body MS-ring/collar protein FliF n=1 Tax=uncultured Legionella sp. TaxID=210934 RepID=UPI00262C7E6E|nr:flagellar basal-body MS-ring/collar protein FliF [uncultured Legionella sp.]
MNFLQQTQHWFQELPSKRKVTLSVLLIVLMITTALISWWALSPDFAVLFQHLEEQDANKIISQLDQEHIDYQLRHGGSDILIDKNLIAKTRLKIMSSGIQLNGSVGFELFDKSDFGMTDFSQKINYQRALQGELERTISSFDEVRQARVHLVLPENHLFDKGENQPKAAVTLNLKHKLTYKQVLSIQQLLTASVAHLTIKNVVVVDQNGNTLSQFEEENNSNHFKAKKNIERYLNDKVTQLLATVFSHNQVMVKIDVAINYDELQRELINPQSQGLITHEKEIKHSSSSATDKTKNNQDVTMEKSYQFGSQKELFKKASGTIERLTISVVVPNNTSIQTIDQVQRLVKSTVGFNEQRGDNLSVEALIEPTAVPISEPTIIHENPIQKSDTRLLAYFIIFCLTMSATATLIIKSVRNKKRQVLLLELTEWLSHHE